MKIFQRAQSRKRVPSFFALAALRSVPQAGSQFRGRSRSIMKYSGPKKWPKSWGSFNLISGVCQRNLGLRPVRSLWILDFDMHSYLSTTETRRARRELYSCPIGRRRSGKRSQPCGHDLVTGWLHFNGWIQDKELSPQAEALFPGRRLPAREKTTSSVYSVPLW